MDDKALRGDRLRQARMALGLTQKDLAERIGTHLNQINRYENGQFDPSSAQLKRIAKELDVTTDWLLGLVDKQHEQIPMDSLTDQEQQFLQSLRDGNFRKLLSLIQHIAPDKQEQSGVSDVDISVDR